MSGLTSTYLYVFVLGKSREIIEMLLYKIDMSYNLPEYS